MRGPIDYVCTACRRHTPRDQLSAKKVVFSDMGTNAQVSRTRTVAWLCSNCLASDSDYNLPAHMSVQERIAYARAGREASEAKVG